MTIGVKFDVPPFGVKNPQTNEVEGFDIEMGKAVAAKLGFVHGIIRSARPSGERGAVADRRHLDERAVA